MATTPSTFARLQTSLEATWLPPGVAITTVTRPLPIPFRKPVARAAGVCTLPKEPEDARLTGGTRSLDRRLLALNLYVSPAGTKAVAERRNGPPQSAVA
jgi:hypothetical protein